MEQLKVSRPASSLAPYLLCVVDAFNNIAAFDLIQKKAFASICSQLKDSSGILTAIDLARVEGGSKYDAAILKS